MTEDQKKRGFLILQNIWGFLFISLFGLLIWWIFSERIFAFKFVLSDILLLILFAFWIRAVDPQKDDR